MRTALFGGSFNPIHQGHTDIASAVFQELQYQKIIFVPAYCSPFKLEDSPLISHLDRLAIVKLAIEGQQAFECSSYEIERNEPSFTIHTIEHLYSLYGKNSKDRIEGKLGLIIGSDQVLQFEKWKDYKKILQLCDLIVVARRSEDTNEQMQAELHSKLSKVNFKFTLLKTPIKAISSSTIRTIIQEEKNWKERLINKALNIKVANYLEENALYGSLFEAAFSNLELLIEEVTTYAKSELSNKRFLHSMRVASMAERLAKLYSPCVPPRLAYLAGVAHDITKEKADEWQKETIEAEGESLDEIEKQHLRLLHGRTAAILLKKHFGIKHRSLLDSIRNHTFAHPLLDDLGKILYIADKIEDGRQDAQKIREMIATASINEIMIAVLEQGEEILKAKGTSLHPFAVKLLTRLKKIEVCL